MYSCLYAADNEYMNAEQHDLIASLPFRRRF